MLLLIFLFYQVGMARLFQKGDFLAIQAPYVPPAMGSRVQATLE